MIKYALRCAEGHPFEAWFKSSSDFDDQNGKGLLSCPVCASAEIDKAPMAPSVVTKDRRASPGPVAPQGAAPASEPQGAESVYTPSPSDPPLAKVLEVMRRVRDHVVANTEDVGKRFAEEARKIHYEEVEPRGIRGEASAEEVRELESEGIAVAPVPHLPEDKN